MSEANKAVCLKWFETLHGRDIDAARALTDPDFRYYMPGSMPVSGWHDWDGFIGTMDILADTLAGPIDLTFGDVVAEGDRVMIEAQGDGPLKNGKRYQNVYIMALRVKDGKVAELKEFSDVLHTYEVMDHPRTRGPSEPRYGHLPGKSGVFGEPVS